MYKQNLNLFLILILIVLLTACSGENTDTGQSDLTDNSGMYALNDIFAYKTPYVGDNSKVSHMAGRLPLPDERFIQKYIRLQTDEEPYGLYIGYEPEEAPLNSLEGLEAESSFTMYYNALVLFCGIDNLGEVTFLFSPKPTDGQMDFESYQLAYGYNRIDLENAFGDLSRLGENLEELNAVLDTAFKMLTSMNDIFNYYIDSGDFDKTCIKIEGLEGDPVPLLKLYRQSESEWKKELASRLLVYLEQL